MTNYLTGIATSTDADVDSVRQHLVDGAPVLMGSMGKPECQRPVGTARTRS